MVDVSDPALAQAYQEVRDDSNDTNWTVFGYEGNAIKVQGKGSGDIEELKGVLSEEEAQFAYLRVTSGDSESKRSKFVFISWVGERLGALKRAKVSVHKASVKQVVQSYAIEVHAEHLSELKEDDILAKVRKAGGADYSGNLANSQN